MKQIPVSLAFHAILPRNFRGKIGEPTMICQPINKHTIPKYKGMIHTKSWHSVMICSTQQAANKTSQLV